VAADPVRTSARASISSASALAALRASVAGALAAGAAAADLGAADGAGAFGVFPASAGGAAALGAVAAPAEVSQMVAGGADLDLSRQLGGTRSGGSAVGSSTPCGCVGASCVINPHLRPRRPGKCGYLHFPRNQVHRECKLLCVELPALVNIHQAPTAEGRIVEVRAVGVPALAQGEWPPHTRRAPVFPWAACYS
jgi:hypothetical protein